jgi:hypothetical protein
MREMNPAEMLRDDHAKVRELFARFAAAGEDQRDVALQIATEISVHAELEEQVYYPEMRRLDGLAEVIDHGLEEHKEVEGVIQRLQNEVESGGDVGALVEQLQALVEEHVEEEERDVIPRTMELGNVEELSVRMKERKEMLMLRSGAAGGDRFGLDRLSTTTNQ